MFDVVGGKLGIHGQRENTARSTSSVREGVSGVAERFIDGLQVERDRIVDGGLDVMVGEVMVQGVAGGTADGVVVKRVENIRGFEWCGYLLTI